MLRRQMILWGVMACLLIGVFSAVSMYGQTLTVNDSIVNLSDPLLNTEAGVFLPLFEASAAVGATALGRPTENSACLRTATGLVEIAAEALLIHDGIVYIRPRALSDAVGGKIHVVAGSVFIEVAAPELRLIQQGDDCDELLLRFSSYAPMAVDWSDDVTLRLRIPLCTISSAFEARTLAANHVVSVRAVPTSSSSIDVLIRLTQSLLVAVESQEASGLFSVRLQFGERQIQQASLPLGESASLYVWHIPCGAGTAMVAGVWIREWRNAYQLVLDDAPSMPVPSDEAATGLDWIVSASATPIDTTNQMPAGFALINGSIIPSACGTSGSLCIDLFGRLEFAELPPVTILSSGDFSLAATATNRAAGKDELVILQAGYTGALSESPEPLRVVTIRNGYVTSAVDSRYPHHDPSLVTAVASGTARDLLSPLHVGASVRVETSVPAARTFQSVAGGGTLLFHEGIPILDSTDVQDDSWAWATVIADDWTGGLGILSVHAPSDSRSVVGLISTLSQLPFQLCNAVLFANGSLIVRSDEQNIPLVEPTPGEIRLTVIPRTP
ncbi:hypothetical protein JW848_04720 [Candidatus Bipolaricaulota bacterium]|nr:hypothetical protein [Candidatus Bipolaricaulota bacterium]